MNTMKNLKPAYAVKLGKGSFACAKFVFVCKKCGEKVESDDRVSPDSACSKGGSHVFVRYKL